ncbi:MAG: hypothetical protein Q7S86_01370 [bacterium]|nr:hypothetical protein [bacterium]
MKNPFRLIVAAIVAFTSLTSTLTNAATKSVIEIKPGATNVTVATLQSAVGHSFTFEKLSLTNLSEVQKVVFASGENVFQEIVLKGQTNASEVRQELDLLASLQKVTVKEDFSESFERPFLFGKPFAFTNAPAGPVSLVIGLVRENAWAGDYLVTIYDSKGKKVAERRLRVVPEYQGHVAELVVEMKKVEKLLAEAEAFRAVLTEISQATDEFEKLADKLTSKPPK